MSSFDWVNLIPNLIWIVPIAGAALSVIASKAGGTVRNAVAVIASLLSALLATSLFIFSEFTKYTTSSTNGILDIGPTGGAPVSWIPSPPVSGIPSLNISAGVLVDPLTAVLVNAVSWISFLIMVYSLGYMRGEKNLTRYYFLMNFFIGNMLLLVLSDNFLLLFLGWEGVGYCSYALIGFWHSDETKYWVGTIGEETAGVPEAYSPTHAGMKAFIMTRAGDVAFLIGVLLIFAYSGTFNFLDLFKALHNSSPNWASSLSSVGLFIPAGLLIFGGAIGKSAQFPLQEWLPDAMAGPTSVSALIHAATMVNAGVFLIGTVGPLFVAASQTLGPNVVYSFFMTVAVIGGFTAFLAATQAMVLDELKKVLAYSTVSQIGYMMLGLGIAGISPSADFSYGYTAAFFHLVSQALFKAGLFMCAGWLIHVTESKYMRDMGGLRKDLRITFVSMFIVALSLAGIFPLSGFWSKDAILTAVSQAGGIGADLLYVLGLATALATSFYSTRMIGLIFFGKKSENVEKISEEERGHHEGEHGGLHEAPKSMWIPYSILASATIAVGILAPIYLEPRLGNLFSGYLGQWNVISPYNFDLSKDAVSLGIGLTVAVLGFLIGYLGYIRRSFSPSAILDKSGFLLAFHSFFSHRWYFNAIYYKLFAYPVQKGSMFIFNNFEKKVIDPVNIGATELGGEISDALRKIETGVEEEYLLAFGMGIIMLVILLFVFGQV